jgi:glutamine cyclotransferase
MELKKVILYISILTIIACNNTSQEDATDQTNTVDPNAGIVAPTPLNYTLVKVYPHDTSAYTQGLEWHQNRLYESTGLKGKSRLFIMNDQLQPIGKQVTLDAKYFGEGITIFKDKIYQLTWEEHKVFVYDAITLKKIQDFNWPYEGWGITHNDSTLIISTGSSNLYFVNPTNFEIERTIGVYHQYGYQSMLNELEYINGKIFANIYGQNDIVIIDPNTGSIVQKMDCSNLLAQAKISYNPLTIDGGYVLNGIAFNTITNTLFLSGKCWPAIMEIKLH